MGYKFIPKRKKLRSTTPTFSARDRRRVSRIWRTARSILQQPHSWARQKAASPRPKTSAAPKDRKSPDAADETRERRKREKRREVKARKAKATKRRRGR